MKKKNTPELLKEKRNLFIIEMLKAFPNGGLELKHLRYELIGPEDLKKNLDEIDKFLEGRRIYYINKIQRGYFKKFKTPVSRLDKCLKVLRRKDHHVIELKNHKYRICDIYNLKKMISTYDTDNIDYPKYTQKLDIIDDFGIHLYGFPGKELFDFCNNKKILFEIYNEGYKKISEGTELLQDIIIYISSQIKINIFKKIIKTLNNDSIDLFEKQLLLSLFASYLNSPLRCEKDFYSWFDTIYSKDWLNSKYWRNRCKILPDGEFKPPELAIEVKEKPSLRLIEYLRKIDPSKSLEEIYNDFSKQNTNSKKKKSYRISNDVSECLISIVMLRQIPKMIGNLCVVSYHHRYDFSHIPQKNGEFLNLSVSNELNLNGFVKKKNGYKTIKTYDGLNGLCDELLSDFGPVGSPMQSYLKKRIIYGAKSKRGHYSELFKELMENEIMECEPFSLMLKAKSVDDIISILKPKK